ncbi:MAG: condensation domain-containing protein, partial [Alphaproteobacteria bacterium]
MNDAGPVENPGNGMTSGFPLTLAQRRIWSLEQIGNATVFPLQVLSLVWNETVTRDQVQSALVKLAQRHAALRTRFRRFPGGRIEQFAIADEIPSIEILGSASNPLDASQAEQQRDAFASRPFDLLHDASCRCQIIVVARGRILSTIVVHPIACDTAALSLLHGELVALVKGDTLAPNDDDGLQRGIREEELLAGDAFAAALSHWRDHIGQEYTSSALPTRFNGAGYAGAGRRHVSFQLDAPLWAGMRAFADHHDTTPDLLLSAAFAILLARYSGTYAVQYGVLLSNRETAENRLTVCRSEQILPVKIGLASRARVLDVCRSISAAVQAGTDHPLPFERLVAEIQNHED